MLFLPRSLWRGEGIALAPGSLETERGGLLCSSATFGGLAFLFGVVAITRAGMVFVDACKRGEQRGPGSEKSLSRGDAAPWECQPACVQGKGVRVPRVNLRGVSEGETLAEIFSLSAKVLWDVCGRTLPTPAQGCDRGITKNTNVPNRYPGWGGHVPWLCGATLSNWWLLFCSFPAFILSAWINGTQEKKVGFSTGISPET